MLRYSNPVYRSYFDIADITIQFESDLPITKHTFSPKFGYFKVKKPGRDIVILKHHFSLPDLSVKDLGREFYRRPPWAVYKKGNSWVYLGISSSRKDKTLHRVAIFNSAHSRASIYNEKKESFLKGNLHSLSMFPTDQIILARILAEKRGCYLHACGVDFTGKGLLFIGHSGAGKSTIAKILKSKARILCDDRIIIRRQMSGFKIYGTWNHGEVPDISPESVPLRAIFFLEKAQQNLIVPLSDKKEITKRILACIIRPFITAGWWEKTLLTIEGLSNRIPCYLLRFNKSPEVIKMLEEKI